MLSSLDVERYAPGPFRDRHGLALVGHWTAARAVAVSPDGARLAFAGGESWASRGLRVHRAVIVLVDVATGRELQRLAGHADPVLSLAFSADGARLCSVASGPGAAAKLWDVATGACLATRTLAGRPRRGALLPDGRALVAGEGGLAVLTARLKPASALAREGYAAELLAVSADGRRAVTTSGGAVSSAGDEQPPRGGALVGWDLAGGVATASQTLDPPVALALSPDGAVAAVVHAPGAPSSAEAYRVATARLYNTGMYHPVERLLDPSFAKRVSVFEGPALAPRWSLDLGADAQAAAFSPDGAELALVGRRGEALVLRRVRAADGAVLAEATHRDPVRCDVAAVALGAGVLAAATYYRVSLFEVPWPIAPAAT